MFKKLMVVTMLFAFLATTSFAFASDVYVTKRGKKYHKKICRMVKDRETTVLSKEEAVKAGYTPCKRCFKEDVIVEDVAAEDVIESDDIADLSKDKKVKIKKSKKKNKKK